MGFFGIFRPSRLNIILAIVLILLSTAFSYYFIKDVYVHPSDPFQECGMNRIGFPVPFYFIEIPCYDAGLGGLGSFSGMFKVTGVIRIISMAVTFLIDVFIWYIISAFISYGIINLVKEVRKST